MSVQRERTYSFRSKQVLVKVNHLSKRLPQDFFLQKKLSSSPKKRQSEFKQKEMQNWYQRDDSGEKGANKVNSRFIRRKNVVEMCRVGNQMQPQANFTQNQSFFNKVLENSMPRKNIILKIIKQPKIQTKIKAIARLPSTNERKRQSSERIIKSQSKRYRRYQSPISQRNSIVKQARMSLKELQRQPSPSRYEKMNVGFDGLLTFSRFA